MEQRVRCVRRGYEVNTSSDHCIDAISSYYQQILSYGRKRKLILEAPLHDKDCVLGNILAAHFLSSSDPSRANSYVRAAASHLEHTTSYEKAVFEAVDYLISENRDDDVAFELHFKLLKRFPKDLVSLKRAHILCFYMGRPDLLLALVEEIGRMAEAEEAAKKGYEIDKEDSWAQHCLCHVLQYECRFKEAIEFMEECSATWASCSSFMYTHHWWHVALCYLEGNAPINKVRDIHDHCIWKELEKGDSAPPEVYLNALGLLLRLDARDQLDGFADRLKILADSLTDQANWCLEWHLDILTIWALAKVGETSRAHELFEGLKFRLYIQDEHEETTADAERDSEAVYECGRGNYKQALELLGPYFDALDYKAIGASDKQIDVFNEIWYKMLLSTGQSSTAIEEIKRKMTHLDRSFLGVCFSWLTAYAVDSDFSAIEEIKSSETLGLCGSTHLDRSFALRSINRFAGFPVIREKSSW